MELQIWPDHSAWVAATAEVVIAQVQRKPNSVLSLATGNTTVSLHAALVAASCTVDFSQVIVFGLDEYVGLPPGHPASCLARLHNQLFQYIPIPPNHIHWPKTEIVYLDTACVEYENEIREQGGIDLQILGIGLNGHIGFNEPGTPFETNTHVVALSESTRAAKAHYFDSADSIPTLGITMGIGTILRARRLVLLAFGAEKSEIIRRTLQDPIANDVPSTALRLHPHLTVILDREAATSVASV